jgi:hypothetical protein
MAGIGRTLSEQPAAPTDQIDPGAITRRAAPRLVRDAFGPLACFFAGWKLVGLGFGIGLALAFGLAVYFAERRSERPGALVRVALALVCLRAIVGISSGSATVYLAQEIGIDLLLGTIVLGSVAAGRPIAGWIAGDIFPLDPAMRRTPTFRHTIMTVSVVWGIYFFCRAAVRLAALLTLGTDSYVLVVAVSDVPFLVALLAWSVYWSVGEFRRSGQLGAALAAQSVSRHG